MTFACQNCGITEDGIGDGHGRCPTCGQELQFITIAPPIITGIEKHFQEQP